tara:strand:- start:261 stop:836 length:576 start_codon:yes stop_codon:yes gene_type:complete
VILFTGCSITWGDDLENRLQDRFTKSYPNIAECGISNDMMVMKTIEYIDRTPNVDFVVAQFTVPRRSTYYDGKWKSITPWTKNVESKVYYKYLDSQELRMMNLWKNVYILDQYLQDIPHYFWRLGEYSEKDVTEDCIFKNLSPWSDMVTLYDLIGTPDGSPENYYTGHPNKKGHDLIAQHLQGVVPNSLYH